MLYFAYGSNMSRAPMRRRCPTAREIGRAALRDHRFLIMANGYASVTRAAGDIVHGLLWRIGAGDLMALDDYEDVAGGLYTRVALPVVTDGVTVEALVYVGCERREGRPAPAYMTLVLDAARQGGLPDGYIGLLERWGCAPVQGGNADE